ncbi:DinB family protein [Nitratifractor sp.]
MVEKDSAELIEGLPPAGAGIPSYVKISGRYLLFPLLDRVLSWEKTWEIYEREGRRVVELASSLEREALMRRVLVPRLFGLEENSRYYSAAMVIEHLLIVGEALVGRIPPLSRGETLPDEVRIEEVKPYREIDERVVERFAGFLSGYRERLESDLGDIHRSNYSSHPWFGPFNPKRWATLGMVHQIVHRRQMEAILRRLDAGKSEAEPSVGTA